MKYIVFYILLVCSECAVAQTPREVITQMNKSYLLLKSYRVQLNYKLYTDGKAVNPIESMLGELDRTTDCYYFKLADAEYLRNGKYMLAIDHDKKLIILNKSAVQIPTPLSFVDTVMANYGFNIKEIPGDKEMYHYVLTPPSTEMEEYERVDLYISRREKDIKRIVLYLVEQQEGESEHEINDKTIDLKKPRIEIEYLHLAKNVPIEPSFFSESKFLVPGKNGKLTLSNKYVSYKLFNQL